MMMSLGLDIDSEVIDGVEIIYIPKINDIVYSDRGHPGTIDLINVLCTVIIDDGESNYSPKVYKVVKKKLRGRKFLVRTTQNQERTSWREATKAENIYILGDCFDEEKKRHESGAGSNLYCDDDDDENDSEIHSSLAHDEVSNKAIVLNITEARSYVKKLSFVRL